MIKDIIDLKDDQVWWWGTCMNTSERNSEEGRETLNILDIYFKN